MHDVLLSSLLGKIKIKYYPPKNMRHHTDFEADQELETFFGPYM